MAISSKQIQQERDEKQNLDIEQCEASIDTLLRQLWKEDNEKEFELNITQNLNKYPQVLNKVVENYEREGWRINKIQFGPSYPVNYFIRQK